jgi:aspartyl protease family protein
MMKKVLPFVFLAIGLALVPQFLESNGSFDVKEPSVSASKVSSQASSQNASQASSQRQQQAKSSAHYTSGKRQVSIKADARGHYIASFKANGRPIKGLIDTGATYIAMNETTARQVGLRVSASDFKHTASTANGKTSAAFAILDRLKIGSIEVSNIDVFILKDRALSETLIGMSFISKLSSFKVENSKLILTQ